MIARLQKAATVAFVTLCSVCIAAVLAGYLAGWQTMVVTTGSMSPTYPAGSLIIVEPSADSYEVGDVIVFPHPEASDVRVTHRVTAVEEAGYRTRGDANADDDRWTVPPTSVFGTVRAGAPGLGLALTRFRTGPGPWLLAGLILLVEGVRQLRSWQAERGEDEPSASAAGLVALAGTALLLVDPLSTVAVFRDAQHLMVSASTGRWSCEDDDPGRCGDGSTQDDACADGDRTASCEGFQEPEEETDAATEPTGAEGSPDPAGARTSADEGPDEPSPEASGGGSQPVEPSDDAASERDTDDAQTDTSASDEAHGAEEPSQGPSEPEPTPTSHEGASAEDEPAPGGPTEPRGEPGGQEQPGEEATEPAPAPSGSGEDQ